MEQLNTIKFICIFSIFARFVPHCNRALQHFNLQFNQQGQSGALQFCWAIPSEIQQGFESYRRQFIARKRARQAKLKAA